jgi:hypothetical protein
MLVICDNPNVNIEACNEVQCNQSYIDNYAACQCLRSRTEFYEVRQLKVSYQETSMVSSIWESDQWVLTTLTSTLKTLEV